MKRNLMTYDRDLETPCPICNKLTDAPDLRKWGACQKCRPLVNKIRDQAFREALVKCRELRGKAQSQALLSGKIGSKHWAVAEGCEACEEAIHNMIDTKEEKKVNPETLCRTCEAKPGKARVHNGIPSGTHCDKCWSDTVYKCTRRSW